jgi:hypothetical protein
MAGAERQLARLPCPGGRRPHRPRRAGHEEIASELTDRLADLLVDDGDLDGAEQILRARVDAGDEHAAGRLPELLIKQGRGEEAEGCAGSA